MSPYPLCEDPVHSFAKFTVERDLGGGGGLRRCFGSFERVMSMPQEGQIWQLQGQGCLH